MFIRRLPERMINCWNTLRKDEVLPHFGTFRSDLIPDLWSHCFTVDVIKEKIGYSYIYSYVGPEIVNAYGSDVKGSKVTGHLKGVPGEKIVAKFDPVILKTEPSIEEGIFLNNKNKTVKYRSCILPFGNDGAVTNLVVGLAWQITG